LLLFCFGFTNNPAFAAEKAETVTLQLIWKNQFQFAGYYAAKELGFYDDAGLDVTINEHELGTDVTDDVVSRKAHFGVGRSSLILEIMEGKPVTLISAIFQHSPFMLLAKKRGDLKDVLDLKGKRIMVPDDAVGMASLTAMLFANGIQADDYNLQKHTFNIDDLISGNTDAMVAYISNEPYQMEKRGVDYTIFAPRDHGFDFYSDILFTSQKLYKENPHLVERFHRASLRGWEYAFSHIDELVDIILKKYNTQNRSKDALRFEANTLKKLAYDRNTSLGLITKDRLERIAQVYQLLGFTNKPLKTDNLFYDHKDTPQIKLTSQEQAWLKDHRVIRVHNEKAWPPFNYFENGSPLGLSIDYMNLLAERLGVKVEYVTGPSWNEFLGMIQKKDLDIMLNIVKTEDRMKYLLYTEPYIRNPNVIISSEKHPYETIQKLFGKTVAIPKGFFYEEVLTKSFPQIKLLLVEDSLAGLKAVTFGKADAALGEEAVVRTLVNKNMLTGLRISGEVEIGNPDLVNLRIGVRDDWPLLQSAIMKAMAGITPQEMNQLRQKWLVEAAAITTAGAESEFESRFLLLKLFAWFAALVAVLLVLLAIFKRLRGETGDRIFERRNLSYIVMALVAGFLTVVLFVAWLALERMDRQLREDLGGTLVTVNNAVNKSLDMWSESRANDAHHVVDDGRVLPLVEELLALPRNAEALLRSDALRKLREIYRYHNQRIDAKGFFIISPDGIILASSRDSNMGSRNLIAEQKPELMARVFAGESVFVPPIFSDVALKDASGRLVAKAATIFFAEPVHDASGKVIAALTLRFDPVENLSSVTRTGRVGETGETYAFDRDARLLTESRFDTQLETITEYCRDGTQLLSLRVCDPGGNLVEGYRPEKERSSWPLTRMAKEALAGRSGVNVVGYRDYRGIPVIGAWIWSEKLGIGLATEIDLSEALEPYNAMRTLVLVVLGGITFIALLLTALSVWLGERARSRLTVMVEKRTAELAEAEERSRLLLESVGDGVFGVDTKGKVIFINPIAYRMLGYSSEELLGMNVHETTHHSHADGSLYPKDDCPMEKAYTEGSSFSVDDEILWRKDGTNFPVEYSATPIGHGETIVGAVVVFRDITERKDRPDTKAM
jgi:PAS domain S-box-containing protein